MIACSRPPPPTTRTLIAARRDWLQGLGELLGGDRGHGLVGGGAARAELHGDLGHRPLVRRLDHAHEVVFAERRPLAEHLNAELLDLLVDLLDPSRVVLEGLHAVRGEPRQHDEYGHLVLLLVPLASAYLPSPRLRRRVGVVLTQTGFPLVCGALGRPDRKVLRKMRKALGGGVREVHRDDGAVLHLDREPLRWSASGRQGLCWSEQLPPGQGAPTTWLEASSDWSACGLAIDGERRLVHSSVSGISPLYYLDDGEATYFSSRIDALVAG